MKSQILGVAIGLMIIGLIAASAAALTLRILGGKRWHLNKFSGWQRVSLVASGVVFVGAFIVFLGDPEIYDAANLGGSEGQAWLSNQKSEWWWRCLPGTWSATSSVIGYTARFSCHSTVLDGIPAALGALTVTLAFNVVILIGRWVAKGFADGK